ncbi:MAG: YicC family protein [Planctomycetes bacterium]|nr:YicC family protein [Planctomycetota bacterium]
MIRSMTGFGQACAEADGVVYTVEIRSVNNRYFKTQIRLPDIAAFLEGEVEKLHRENIQRGTINYSLRMKNISGRALFDIDEQSLAAYVQRLKTLLPEDDQHCRLDLGSLLSLPGIVQPAVPTEEQAERMRHVVMSLTQEALEQLSVSRAEEGEVLRKDLLANCDRIVEQLGAIGARVDTVLQDYHDRLKNRVENLLAQAKLKLDENLLVREVAIFAERSDIAEEVSRLNAHLQQFKDCCQKGGPVGRRLDFVTQEMLREANTIGSKSVDAAIAQSVIEIKCAVDRIKEQVQNVE